jgi:hypothetical protein
VTRADLTSAVPHTETLRNPLRHLLWVCCRAITTHTPACRGLPWMRMVDDGSADPCHDSCSRRTRLFFTFRLLLTSSLAGFRQCDVFLRPSKSVVFAKKFFVHCKHDL